MSKRNRTRRLHFRGPVWVVFWGTLPGFVTVAGLLLYMICN